MNAESANAVPSVDGSTAPSINAMADAMHTRSDALLMRIEVMASAIQRAARQAVTHSQHGKSKSAILALRVARVELRSMDELIADVEKLEVLER